MSVTSFSDIGKYHTFLGKYNIVPFPDIYNFFWVEEISKLLLQYYCTSSIHTILKALFLSKNSIFLILIQNYTCKILKKPILTDFLAKIRKLNFLTKNWGLIQCASPRGSYFTVQSLYLGRRRRTIMNSWDLHHTVVGLHRVLTF